MSWMLELPTIHYGSRMRGPLLLRTRSPNDAGGPSNASPLNIHVSQQVRIREISEGISNTVARYPGVGR